MEKENYSKNFRNLDLKEEILDSKNFEDCLFENCSFVGTSLKGTSFVDCVFRNSKISLAKLDKSTKLQHIEFERCDILGIIFSNCKSPMISFDFSECHLKHCDFSELKLESTKFIKCLIEGCDFIKTNLKKANFRQCRLPDTVIQGCNLMEANFLKASDFSINPSENKLFNAKFSKEELGGLVKSFGIKVE